MKESLTKSDTGTKIKLLPAGDVDGAISTGFKNTGVDLLLGSGGAPEGVLQQLP